MTHNSLGKLLLLGMVAALSAAGCNANPVAASAGSQAAVGYKQDARANQAPQVDILWVIDNSGTMAEEQGSVIDNFHAFINKVVEAKIDFHIGVTTTDAGNHNMQEASGWNIATSGGVVPGELRKVPTPELPSYADFSSSFIAERTLAALLKTAYSCAGKKDDTVPILKKILDDLKWKGFKERGGNADTADSFEHNQKLIGQVVGKVNESLKTLTFTVPAALQNKNYLARDDYQKKGADGSLDVDQLTKDFSCMALVGTSGYGLERGLRASLQAVEQSKVGGKNEGFIRSTAKFGVIYITDENDCSLDYKGKGHSGTINETACGGRLCDYFLDPSIPEGENPLMSVSSVKDKLLQALKDVKGVDVVDKDVIAGAVTGPSKSPKQNVFPPADAFAPFTADPSQFRNFLNQGENFNPPDLLCEGMPGYNKTNTPKANESISVCNSPAFGVSWSGSRYLQFVDQFPNHYPSLDAAGTADGLMCAGEFSGVFDALGKLFAGGSTCITNELYGCGEGKAEGDDCGPEELHGKCMKNVGDGRTDLYCSSAVRLVAYPKDEEQGTRLGSSGFCIEGSQGTLPENARACILRTDLYEFVACPSPAKGMLFHLKDPKDINAKLANVPIDLEFTAHPPSDSDEETPSAP